MLKVRYWGKQGKSFSLSVSSDSVVVRTHSGLPIEQSPLTQKTRQLVDQMETVARFPEAGVEVIRAKSSRESLRLRDRVRTALKKERDSRFSGRVLCDPHTKSPILYTENVFVKFEDDYSPTAAKRLIKNLGLTIKYEIRYAQNAYFLESPEGTGQKIFTIADMLLKNEHVQSCHPELVREARTRTAFAHQWHLKSTTINGQNINAHAHVEKAWEITKGKGITIAIIDDGVDIDHEEFQGATKIVAPRDVTRGTNNPRPGRFNNHGTACAGVACANGTHGASGVAPDAKLLPIRLVSGLGSQAEADAFVWAADNGADVISCSWGPPDGKWWSSNDPHHHKVVPLPDSTSLAIEYALKNGRNGKGCVITWAAGNGNESVDNDGYATHPGVIAVAACNDKNQKSIYSDYGDKIWCSFPSNDFQNNATPGIWTTDQRGNSGYNIGKPTKGDPDGHYTNSFGGTSSACPGVAGVAALILSREPNLLYEEVKERIKNTCDQIDKNSVKGKYEDKHSQWYGFGRVNAEKAVIPPIPDEPEGNVVNKYHFVSTFIWPKKLEFDIKILGKIDVSILEFTIESPKTKKALKLKLQPQEKVLYKLPMDLNKYSPQNEGKFEKFVTRILKKEKDFQEVNGNWKLGIGIMGHKDKENEQIRKLFKKKNFEFTVKLIF